MFRSRTIYRATFAFLLSLFTGSTAFGQSSAFTYQGRLTDSGNPADGLVEMQFKLFDSADFITGLQVGSTITIPTVQVTNGVFTVQLDFTSCPACFNGAARFLEIGLRPAGSPGAFTILSPRQAITSAPYAVRSATAATADNATQLGGQPASGFIQNSNSQQAGTNFNISGDGTAGGTLSGNIVSAGSHYSISGVKVLSVSGLFNNAGIVLQGSNTFAGESAGLNTIPASDASILSGKLNSFFGADAGRANTFGTFNSFFGALAGRANTTGGTNSFFGASAGEANTTGQQNSFFGFEAGEDNTTGTANSFFGNGAGGSTTTGSLNVAIGFAAGFENTTGNRNIFIGRSAGDNNITGSDNMAIGFLAAFGTDNLTNATAIGTRAQVDQSNSLVLGSIAGVNGATANTNVGIGTTMPQHRLDVNGVINAATQYNINGLRMLAVSGPFNNGFTILAASNTFLGESAGLNTTPIEQLNISNGKFNSFFGANAGKANTTGLFNSFVGAGAGLGNTNGSSNSFFGADAGKANTIGAGNSFFGSAAGGRDTTGSNNTFIGFGADFDAENTTGNRNTLLGSNTRVLSGISHATAIGARARVDQSNSLVLGSISGVNSCTAANNCDSVNVGIGTTSPSATLHVVRDTSDVATPVAILESAGNQAPLAFRSEGAEVARVRADNLGNLIFVTLSGASKNIAFRAGDDLGTDLIIQSTGNVGIGDSTPDDKLDVEGDIRVGTGTTGCVKDADGTVLTGSCSSDARLKKQITPFPMLLDKVAMLRPVHFYWRQDEYKDKAFGAGQSFGLIAQEVEEVLPELVTQDEQGLKAVRYNKLPLLMLQAIKELKAENDSLKQELQQLKQMKEELANLKRLVCLEHPNTTMCK